MKVLMKERTYQVDADTAAIDAHPEVVEGAAGGRDADLWPRGRKASMRSR